jgi:uncharacterized protein YjbI with pentapeptide repeats
VICARHDRLWQAKPGGARAVFAWMDLSGLSLAGRNLADADFAAACLIGSDLTGCRLDNATFFGADMQDAVFRDASMRRCRSARRLPARRRPDRSRPVRGGPARRGHRRRRRPPGLPRDRGPLVRDTRPRAPVWPGANLERSKLTGVVAVAADFTDAIMKDCKLVRANLKQASFKRRQPGRGRPVGRRPDRARTCATPCWWGSNPPCGGPTERTCPAP